MPPRRTPKGSRKTKQRLGTVRVTLDLSEPLKERLDALAAKTHNTKSELLRRAISLLEVAMKANEEGKRVGVAASDQRLETEFVGL